MNYDAKHREETVALVWDEYEVELSYCESFHAREIYWIQAKSG